MTPGEAAYRAFWAHYPSANGGGGFLDRWNDMPRAVKAAWEAAATAAIDHVMVGL